MEKPTCIECSKSKNRLLMSSEGFICTTCIQKAFKPKKTSRRGKYNNQRTFYKGFWYDSKAEAREAHKCDMLLRAGEIEYWERQVPIVLGMGREKLKTKYIIDFVRKWKSTGVTEYVEVKGHELPLWKLKWEIFVKMMQGKKKIKITLIKK